MPDFNAKSVVLQKLSERNTFPEEILNNYLKYIPADHANAFKGVWNGLVTIQGEQTRLLDAVNKYIEKPGKKNLNELLKVMPAGINADIIYGWQNIETARIYSRIEEKNNYKEIIRDIKSPVIAPDFAQWLFDNYTDKNGSIVDWALKIRGDAFFKQTFYLTAENREVPISEIVNVVRSYIQTDEFKYSGGWRKFSEIRFGESERSRDAKKALGMFINFITLEGDFKELEEDKESFSVEATAIGNMLIPKSVNSYLWATWKSELIVDKDIPEIYNDHIESWILQVGDTDTPDTFTQADLNLINGIIQSKIDRLSPGKKRQLVRHENALKTLLKNSPDKRIVIEDSHQALEAIIFLYGIYRESTGGIELPPEIAVVPNINTPPENSWQKLARSAKNGLGNITGSPHPLLELKEPQLNPIGLVYKVPLEYIKQEIRFAYEIPANLYWAMPANFLFTGGKLVSKFAGGAYNSIKEGSLNEFDVKGMKRDGIDMGKKSTSLFQSILTYRYFAPAWYQPVYEKIQKKDYVDALAIFWVMNRILFQAHDPNDAWSSTWGKTTHPGALVAWTGRKFFNVSKAEAAWEWFDKPTVKNTYEKTVGKWWEKGTGKLPKGSKIQGIVRSAPKALINPVGLVEDKILGWERGSGFGKKAEAINAIQRGVEYEKAFMNFGTRALFWPSWDHFKETKGWISDQFTHESINRVKLAHDFKTTFGYEMGDKEFAEIKKYYNKNGGYPLHNNKYAVLNAGGDNKYTVEDGNYLLAKKGTLFLESQMNSVYGAGRTLQVQFENEAVARQLKISKVVISDQVNKPTFQVISETGADRRSSHTVVLLLPPDAADSSDKMKVYLEAIRDNKDSSGTARPNIVTGTEWEPVRVQPLVQMVGRREFSMVKRNDGTYSVVVRDGAKETTHYFNNLHGILNTNKNSFYRGLSDPERLVINQFIETTDKTGTYRKAAVDKAMDSVQQKNMGITARAEFERFKEANVFGPRIMQRTLAKLAEGSGNVLLNVNCGEGKTIGIQWLNFNVFEHPEKYGFQPGTNPKMVFWTADEILASREFHGQPGKAGYKDLFRKLYPTKQVILLTADGIEKADGAVINKSNTKAYQTALLKADLVIGSDNMIHDSEAYPAFKAQLMKRGFASIDEGDSLMRDRISNPYVMSMSDAKATVDKHWMKSLNYYRRGINGREVFETGIVREADIRAYFGDQYSNNKNFKTMFKQVKGGYKLTDAASTEAGFKNIIAKSGLDHNVQLELQDLWASTKSMEFTKEAMKLPSEIRNQLVVLRKAEIQIRTELGKSIDMVNGKLRVINQFTKTYDWNSRLSGDGGDLQTALEVLSGHKLEPGTKTGELTSVKRFIGSIKKVVAL
ncbi:MAG: hypothetical protein ABIH39_09055 [Candidatus Margulisiibacteriota bacterium]